MMSLHKILIQLRNNLGYKKNDRGVCVLYAEKAVDAFLVGEYESVFQKRCEWIEKNYVQWPGLLQQATSETKAFPLITSSHVQELDLSVSEPTQKVTMTDSERHMVFEVGALIDQGDLYQTPESYNELFDRVLSQERIQEISVFAQSDALEQLGGRACMASFMGVYTEEKMLGFLTELNELARVLRHDFAISLTGRNHRIALCYGETKQSWYLIDANNPKIALVSVYDPHAIKHLVVQISQSIEIACANICAFQSYLFTTKRQQRFLQETVNQWKQRKSLEDLHLITQENARLLTKNGVSVAYLAARGGQAEIIKKLIQWGCSDLLDPVRLDTCHIVDMAAYHGSAEVLEVLLDMRNLDGTFVINRNRKGGIVNTVVEQGHIESLRVLMKARHANGVLVADINQLNDHGKSPAFIAARNGHADILRILLEEKSPNQRYVVDSNQYDSEWGTLAYVAAKHGHVNVMQVLLDLQQNPNAPFLNLNRTLRNQTPALIAAEKGHIPILRLLMEAKRPNGRLIIDPMYRYKDGITPLFLAAQFGHTSVVKYLLHTRKMSIVPFCSSAHSLREFAKAYDERVKTTMDGLIRSKIGLGQSPDRLQVMPNEIAAVMGHQGVVDVFQMPLLAESSIFSKGNRKRHGRDEENAQSPKRLKSVFGRE